MAGERVLPGLGLTAFWNAGDNTWKAGMDANLLGLSILAKAVAKSRTTSLPGSPANGDIYIVPDADTDGKKIAYRDNGAWGYITPWEGLRFWIEDEDGYVTYDGTDWDAGTAGAVNEAPSDGSTYGRKNGVWVAITTGGTRTPATKTADYTLVLGDASAKINGNHASDPVSITIPPHSSVAIPVGTWIPVENIGTADVVIEAGSGVTLANGPMALAPNEVAILWKNGNDSWTASKLGGEGGGGTAEYPDMEGQAGKFLRVNAEEDDVEWATAGGSSLPSPTGNAGKVLTVNATEDGVEWTEKAAGGGGATHMSIAFFLGGTPVADEIAGRYICINDFSITTGGFGSKASAGTGPTGGAVVFSLRKNGADIGSLTFSSGSTTGVFSVSSTVAFEVGDRLDVVAPSALRGLEDLAVNILGTL